MALVARLNQPPAAAATPAAGNYNFPNNGNFTVVAAPTRYPLFTDANPAFGEDDYTAARIFKEERDAQRGPAGTGFRHWLDVPGQSVARGTLEGLGTGKDFASFVQGNQGTCWCRYRFA